jgi:exosortase
MSTIVTNPSEPATAKAAARSSGPVAAMSPATILWLALLTIAFVALFHRWIYTQHLHSWDKINDWGHAYVVPLISLYMIWQRRGEIAAAPKFTFWPGLAPLLAGIACYMFFVVGYPNHMFQGFAVVMTLASLVLLVLGPAVLRLTIVPIAFLCLGVTISEMVMLKVTFPLQMMAAKGAYFILVIISEITSLFGYQFFVDITGQQIDITPPNGNTVPLNVAEACSGMRMVVAFIALGTAVALLSCKHWWQRIALVLLSMPVAIGMNVVRVAVLGVAALISPNFSAGDAHMLIGTLLLIPALFVFMGCQWVLERVVAEPATATMAKPATGKGVVR